MSDKSKIQWTDASWNPIRGCTKISPGCKNCYAETFAERWRGIAGHPYEHGFDLRLVPEKLTEPLKWKKGRRIFVNSMSDLFHKDVPFDYIDKVFAVMALCPQHIFQVLTKRPERLATYAGQLLSGDRGLGDALEKMNIGGLAGRLILMNAFGVKPGLGNGQPPCRPFANVWLGFSSENQEWFDKRAVAMSPLMRDGWTVFVSAEPLLGPIIMQGWNGLIQRNWLGAKGISWVITGGESGHGSRVANVQWIRDIVKQCQAAKTAVFVKQLGSAPQISWGEFQNLIQKHPRKADILKILDLDDEDLAVDCHRDTLQTLRLRDRKGGDPSEWPEDIRVREFPVLSG